MGRPVSPSLLRRCPVTGKSYGAQEFVYWQPLTEDALVQLRRDLPAHDMGTSECEHEVRLADDQLTRDPPASSASAHAIVSTQAGHVGGGRAAPRSRPFGGDPLGTQTTACELELGRGKWDAQSQTVLADRRDDRVVCSGQAGVSSTADWTGSSTQTHPRPPARSAAARPHGHPVRRDSLPCSPGISWPADGCTRGNPSATCRSGVKGPVQAGGAGAATTHELVGERDVIGLERGRDVGLGVGQDDGGEGLAGGGEGGVVDAGDARACQGANATQPADDRAGGVAVTHPATSGRSTSRGSSPCRGGRATATTHSGEDYVPAAGTGFIYKLTSPSGRGECQVLRKRSKLTCRSPIGSAEPSSEVNLRCWTASRKGGGSGQVRARCVCVRSGLHKLTDGLERLGRGRPGGALLLQAEVVERRLDGDDDRALERVLGVDHVEVGALAERGVHGLGLVRELLHARGVLDFDLILADGHWASECAIQRYSYPRAVAGSLIQCECVSCCAARATAWTG